MILSVFYFFLKWRIVLPINFLPYTHSEIDLSSSRWKKKCCSVETEQGLVMTLLLSVSYVSNCKQIFRESQNVFGSWMLPLRLPIMCSMKMKNPTTFRAKSTSQNLDLALPIMISVIFSILIFLLGLSPVSPTAQLTYFPSFMSPLNG